MKKPPEGGWWGRMAIHSARSSMPNTDIKEHRIYSFFPRNHYRYASLPTPFNEEHFIEGLIFDRVSKGGAKPDFRLLVGVGVGE